MFAAWTMKIHRIPSALPAHGPPKTVSPLGETLPPQPFCSRPTVAGHSHSAWLWPADPLSRAADSAPMAIPNSRRRADAAGARESAVCLRQSPHSTLVGRGHSQDVGGLRGETGKCACFVYGGGEKCVFL